MPNIPLEKEQFWFRSTLFEVEPGEDSETNPFCYGRQLAKWLASALRDEGMPVEEVFPEDWGWCVMVKKAPFSLWVGCGSVRDYDERMKNNPSSRGEDVVWTCIVVVEVPILRKLFRTHDTAPEVADLLMRVKRLVNAIPGTKLLDEL